ncbi:MAG: hypothetical protein ACXW5U_14225 [Thermoanaerobaculia bacterium]
MRVLLLATAGFVGLHAIGFAITKRPDEPTFSVTRAVISGAVALVAFVVLVEQWPSWRRAFMMRHPTDDLAFHVSALLAASLAADLVWMLGRFLRWRVPSRPDLLVHHVLGLPAIGYAFSHRVGFGLIAIAATTELLATCSGISALGKVIARPALETVGRRCGCAVLVGWRIPLWLSLAILSAMILRDPIARAGFTVEYAILFATTVLLIALDIYWVAEVVAEERAAARARAEQPPSLILRPNEDIR